MHFCVYISILTPVTKNIKVIEEKNKDDYYVLSGGIKYVEPRDYQYFIKTFLRRLKIKSYKFHILRHTFASECIEVGIIYKDSWKNVSKNLIYIHKKNIKRTTKFTKSEENKRKTSYVDKYQVAKNFKNSIKQYIMDKKQKVDRYNDY